MKYISFLVLALVGTSVQAFEQGDTYIGLQVGSMNIDDGDYSVNIPYAALRLGGYVSEHFSVEGRYGTGMASDDVEEQGINVDIDLSRFAGLYLRAHAGPVYALIGYTNVKIKGSADYQGNHFETSEWEDGGSYGAGFEMYGIQLEAIHYVEDTNTISLGYTYYFDRQ